MYFPLGTYPIYKAWCTYQYLGRPCNITAHYVVTGSHTGYTEPEAVAARFDEDWSAIVAVQCYYDTNSLSTMVGLFADWTHTTQVAEYYSYPFGSSGSTIAPEAALLIRRVGAGPAGIVRGRARVGPFPPSLFTDYPRCRWVDNTDPALTRWTAQLSAKQASNDRGCTEVLVNRWTRVATVVDTYSLPCRVGRVWGRAGYPQGKRGPDRGGYGYGGRPWSWKPTPHCG